MLARLTIHLLCYLRCLLFKTFVLTWMGFATLNQVFLNRRKGRREETDHKIHKNLLVLFVTFCGHPIRRGLSQFCGVLGAKWDCPPSLKRAPSPGPASFLKTFPFFLRASTRLYGYPYREIAAMNPASRQTRQRPQLLHATRRAIAC